MWLIVCFPTPTIVPSSLWLMPLVSRISFRTSPAEQSNNRVSVVTFTPLCLTARSCEYTLLEMSPQSPMFWNTTDQCRCGHRRSDHWPHREGDANDGSWCWEISCPCWDYEEQKLKYDEISERLNEVWLDGMAEEQYGDCQDEGFSAALIITDSIMGIIEEDSAGFVEYEVHTSETDARDRWTDMVEAWEQHFHPEAAWA